MKFRGFMNLRCVIARCGIDDGQSLWVNITSWLGAAVLKGASGSLDVGDSLGNIVDWVRFNMTGWLVWGSGSIRLVLGRVSITCRHVVRGGSRVFDLVFGGSGLNWILSLVLLCRSCLLVLGGGSLTIGLVFLGTAGLDRGSHWSVFIRGGSLILGLVFLGGAVFNRGSLWSILNRCSFRSIFSRGSLRDIFHGCLDSVIDRSLLRLWHNRRGGIIS